MIQKEDGTFTAELSYRYDGKDLVGLFPLPYYCADSCHAYKLINDDEVVQVCHASSANPNINLAHSGLILVFNGSLKPISPEEFYKFYYETRARLDTYALPLDRLVPVLCKYCKGFKELEAHDGSIHTCTECNGKGFLYERIYIQQI